MDEHQKLRLAMATVFAVAQILNGSADPVQEGMEYADELLEMNGMVQPDCIVQDA